MEENKNLSLNKNLSFFIGLKDGAFNFNFFFVLFFYCMFTNGSLSLFIFKVRQGSR